MIPNLSESSQVGWGGDKLNSLQAAGAEVALATIAITYRNGLILKLAAEALVNSTQKEANNINHKIKI